MNVRSKRSLELFRYVGQVLFRGFEVAHPTSVYEILRTNSPFVRMLLDHHLDAWLAEAKMNPENKLNKLD